MLVPPVYMGAEDRASVAAFFRGAGFQATASYRDFNRYEAPPDVRADLARLGRARTRWFASDLFRYERTRVAGLPPLPAACNCMSIYEYAPCPA